ncbi:uncharacterized protein ACA1_236050 [Acanthamoeba castellanii str. Neff]|uniref:Uncharacterized protein n=1 Tax=Acanthamoeba castellanii (strain ATCC 30010 / Neff) TaxID=1257118 RepID=L8H1F2_ACACF|nr:uncharacterized protein ACA1_236050 [Acanthamoeba castellanii str. Neff]ELR19047.1 hypothetical protein ACA1_236050 [Acanthamoeba castellanii str. Neff]
MAPLSDGKPDRRKSGVEDVELELCPDYCARLYSACKEALVVTSGVKVRQHYPASSVFCRQHFRELFDTKVEQEVEALSEYFADIDDTPLEEEEPPGTKWVSMPTLKSPQRLERLSKYPTIAKDYDEYKKALTEAQVSPAPITEFVKDLEDKRLEAVIQP